MFMGIVSGKVLIVYCIDCDIKFVVVDVGQCWNIICYFFVVNQWFDFCQNGFQYCIIDNCCYMWFFVYY